MHTFINRTTFSFSLETKKRGLLHFDDTTGIGFYEGFIEVVDVEWFKFGEELNVALFLKVGLVNHS